MASFKSWAQDVADRLADAGWVRTSDTGILPLPDAEMQAALRSLEFDPLPPPAPVETEYPGAT